MCVFLSLSLSVSLSLCVCVCVCVCTLVPGCLSVLTLTLCLSGSVCSFCLSLWSCLYLSLFPCHPVCVFAFFSLKLYPSVCPSVCPWLYICLLRADKQRLGGDCVNATDCIPGMRCLYRRKRVFDIRTGLCVCPAIEVWNGSICQEDPCRVAVGGACSCPNGYAKVQNPRTGQVFNYMCTDMQDSCQPSPCPYRCIDTSEGPVCRVRRGYLSRGNMLQDIDECAVSQAIRNKPACPGNGTCTNLKGTYACSCASGYSWSASAGMGTMGACVDINECVVKTASCGTSARCINTVGGYSCHCNDGFTGRHPNCRLAISLPRKFS